MKIKKVRRKSWWLTTGIAIGFYIAVRMALRGRELVEEEYDGSEDERED